MVNLATVDGNEAAARVAYAVSEAIAIYPITPASPMGELADSWSASGRPNIFGLVPDVIEMQSEGGAAGALHGALQGGALATTFTASQGLLLMLPNMFKIAGELTPGVIHVAARSVATHALSIFGDHSDVMAARSTGFAMLCSSSPQEAQDLALISHAATLRSRVPFMHFFDGFRTSHEISKIELVDSETIGQMLDTQGIMAHRRRSLDPDHPVLRGTAQNPDVFFQAREAANPFYDRTPDIVQEEMHRFAGLTGRRYRPFKYYGSPTAKRVIVLMGSGCGPVREVVEQMSRSGEEVGCVQIRLFRPFAVEQFIRSLPKTVERIAVLDRTKEPGSVGEPLYQDVVTAVSEQWPLDASPCPQIYGGRYGLSSKEFTPSMVQAIFAHLLEERPKRHFTIGIYDDVSHTSLAWQDDSWREPDYVKSSLFYGLGSDGTVGANKNSVKIVGEETDLYPQGYFVYDSKKAGAVTVSHLRFSPKPVHSSYLIREASFVACHQFEFLSKLPVLDSAAQQATFLLNSPYPPESVWEHLPRSVQKQIIDKQLKFYVIDAHRIARDVGLGGRINTVMQTCFFALSQVLPRDEAIAKIKSAIEKTYSKRGQSVVERNFAAVEAALHHLKEVDIPATANSQLELPPIVPAHAPDFVQRVTAMMIAGKGDLLPVSALPVDGSFPTATAKYEKRSIAKQIPIWEADICIECGLCALVCPHAAIRSKRYEPDLLTSAPTDFPTRTAKGKPNPLGAAMTIQVAPEDCTGCGVCVDVCPAKSKAVAKQKAINMQPKSEHLEQQRKQFDFFLGIPEVDRTQVTTNTVKGSQLLLPIFEYSGACAGCGETPYLKLMSQLFGDRAMIANATGCSSIFGGNLPTTPWSTDANGRGPAWANSLFEDNAEFGLGLRLALDSKRRRAEQLLQNSSDQIGDELVREVLEADQYSEEDYRSQRERLDEVGRRLQGANGGEVEQLKRLLNNLARRSLWIVGGDGWAYDIGYGGLDHVLASERDVNILVLDTGVYSNTGGQASKATPRAATAKFASQGKTIHRKDLGMMAVSYGHVYVAQVAVGANPAQCVRAFHEAESFPGPSLILAYSHCIAHGIDMTTSMSHQKDLVKSGFWPLYRYDPRKAEWETKRPFHLDSHKPSVPFREVALKEARFAMLARTQPDEANRLLTLAQQDIDETWHYYEQLANLERGCADLQTMHAK